MLNAYMVYSRGAGSEEGAILVFAHSVQEARKYGWNSLGRDLTDDYLDIAATRLRHAPWLFEEADKDKLEKGIPHVIDSPRSCKRCELWGEEPISADGLCESCIDDELEEMGK